MTIQLLQILEHLTTMVHMAKPQERHDSLNDDVTVPLEDHVNDKDKTKKLKVGWGKSSMVKERMKENSKRKHIFLPFRGYLGELTLTT